MAATNLARIAAVRAKLCLSKANAVGNPDENATLGIGLELLLAFVALRAVLLIVAGRAGWHRAHLAEGASSGVKASDGVALESHVRAEPGVVLASGEFGTVVEDALVRQAASNGIRKVGVVGAA